MTTHSSILAWDIPWSEEPGGLQSTGSQSDMTEHSTVTSLGFSEAFPKKAFGLHIEGGVGFNQEKDRGKNISWKQQHALIRQCDIRQRGWTQHCHLPNSLMLTSKQTNKSLFDLFGS